MASDRIKQRIERLLDQADQAVGQFDWQTAKDAAQAVLALDPQNTDARTFLGAAERSLDGPSSTTGTNPPASVEAVQPTSFADGRYKVSKFLGEGGKKKVYFAHDATLDRDVAFALIKTEGLDEASRIRVSREAQAMGRLGDHPHIVTVYDLGEENGQPYMVLPVLTGGDVEGLIEKAPDHRVPMEQALKIAKETCLGLEFAHSKGIIHRDLKPGNVWLSEDGTAKIGDFGLAVATDRSRLTQEGMMVGTASYMPPEQALGGEVTAQSDLYSLGAMLYELVTGRPPFIGDESVTIITQHLNTPPVLPTWHNPAISPGLETLIMRLLEKDATKRPTSANEVLQALDSIDSGVVISSADAETPTGPDPVYRRTFVGRETELKKLEGIFDGAISGNGALVMVVGEPGIGKTSITEQLATYVAMRGGKTLVGHCYEEGSMSLPYLAFVESIRSYVLSREPDDLKSELGTGAGEVARIVSEIRDRVQVELPPPGDPEEDRYRLLQAVSGFLRNASTVSPLMVVLEDLHDADRGTLDMLTHVARNLSGSRLLIIGTYRDVEVDRAHPLSAALAELRRIESFDRVPLRGLTIDEVQRMVNSVFGHERAPRELAETIHRQTEGNPLFVQEVLRYFVEEGLMERDGSQLRRVGEEGLADRVPEGLRDVIGKRLTSLAPQTNEVLGIAAVIGRDFRMDVLQQVAGIEDEQLYSALEEATSGAVIEERSTVGLGASFRFTHAFFRQTLYEEIFTPRRLQYHKQVGAALEHVHAGRLEDHATELAEHYAQSTEIADLDKALTYSEMAARRATDVYAYSEAAGLLEQSLQILEVVSPGGTSKRCDLLLDLGQALMRAGSNSQVFKVIAEEAFTIAESQTDRTRASAACQLGLQALRRYGGRFATGTSEHSTWAQRADLYADSETVDRVYADLAIADVNGSISEPEDYTDLVNNAMLLSRRLNDQQAIFSSVQHYLLDSRVGLRDREMEYRLAEEMVDAPKGGVNPQVVREALTLFGLVFLQHGDNASKAKVDLEINRLRERSGDAQLLLTPLEMSARTASLEGRLEDCINYMNELMDLADRLDSIVMATQLMNQEAMNPLIHLGRFEQASEILPGSGKTEAEDISGIGTVIRRPRGASMHALCDAYLGEIDISETAIRKLLTWGEKLGPERVPIVIFGATLRAAMVIGNLELVQRIRQLIAHTEGLYLFGTTDDSCPARILGAASFLLGDYDEARRLSTKAIEQSETLGHRPELALSRLGLAEVLLEHYPDERPEALEHLDFAIAEFQEMKMHPSLERALRHRDILKA